VQYWETGPIPEAHALNGFHSVTLWLEEIEPTADLLINNMGYTLAGQEGNRHRFIGGPDSLANTLDILHRPVQPEDMPDEAVFGAGSIHHIAFRVPTDEEQLEYQSSLRSAGYGVTPVRDRSYFHSIYYREPGGVLFEIATEGPGFAIDEPVESLGENLKLPEWFEPTRSSIEADLQPITLNPVEKVK
jgi:glyoxalase family protein